MPSHGVAPPQVSESATTLAAISPQSSSGGQNTVAQLPVIYISRLGYDLGLNSLDFVVDAWSNGGTSTTVSVVESVYRVTYTASPPGP